PMAVCGGKWYEINSSRRCEGDVIPESFWRRAVTCQAARGGRTKSWQRIALPHTGFPRQAPQLPGRFAAERDAGATIRPPLPPCCLQRATDCADNHEGGDP